MLFRMTQLLAALSAGLLVCVYLSKTPTVLFMEEHVVTHIVKSLDSSSQGVTLYEEGAGLAEMNSSPSHKSINNLTFFAYSESCLGIFDRTPLSPVDWAIVIKSLRERGANTIVIQDELSWERADELELAALAYEIKQIERVVLGIRYRLVPGERELPNYLMPSLINKESSFSDHVLTVNEVLFPPSLSNVSTVRYGFRQDERDDAVLLKQWGMVNGLPSWEIAALSAIHQVELAKVMVQSGCKIRWGETGKTIPINSFTQAQVLSGEVEKTESSAHDLSTLLDKENTLQIKPNEAVVITAQNPRAADGAALQNLVDLNSIIGSDLIKYLKLPSWAMLTVLLAVSLMAVFLLSPRRRMGIWALLFIVLMSLILSASIFDLAKHWCPVVPLWASCLTVYLSGFFSSKLKSA